MTTGDVWHVALAVLASLGGGGAIVVALSSWLGKVWASRILESERAKYAEELERLRSSLEQANRLLQGEIEKTIFVSKVQFETEFRALAEIWRHVARVRSAMVILRPHFDIAQEGETKEQRFDRRFPAFNTAVVEFVNAVDQHSPFYPKEIYEPLDNLVLIAQGERADVMVDSERFHADWYQRGKKNVEEYCAGASRISDLIRGRISKLSVYKVGLG